MDKRKGTQNGKVGGGGRGEEERGRSRMRTSTVLYADLTKSALGSPLWWEILRGSQS